MPGIMLASRTTGRMSFYLFNLDEERWANYGSSRYPRDYRYAITFNGRTVYPSKETETGTSASVAFTGITSGAEYLVTATVSYYDEEGISHSETFSQTFVAIGYPRPSNFSWTTPKVSGQPFLLTAVEWNSLINTVKEFHKYTLGYYNSDLYPMTTVSQGDIFYAARFNEVRFAIGSLVSTGISDKNSRRYNLCFRLKYTCRKN